MKCQLCNTNVPRICYDCHEQIVAPLRRKAAAAAAAADDDWDDIKLDPNRLELTPPAKQKSLGLKDPSKLLDAEPDTEPDDEPLEQSPRPGDRHLNIYDDVPESANNP